MTRLTRAAAFAALASLPGFAIGGLTAQKPLAYAPGSASYHLISVISRSQEQRGQKAEFKITNEQQVTVKLSAHGKDTLDFSYTLDSSKVVSDPPVQLPDVSKLVGTSVQGSMSALGKVYAVSSTAADGDADAKNLTEGMSKFLLTFPENATIGSSWTDTTLNSVSSEGNSLDMSAITTSTLVSDTTFNGQRAWRVERTSVLALRGKQSQAGQELQVEGEGTGDGTYYLGANGVYLGSTATQRMNMRVSLPATGESVPVTQAVTSTVEMIR